jgi:hypothetical protein
MTAKPGDGLVIEKTVELRRKKENANTEDRDVYMKYKVSLGTTIRLRLLLTNLPHHPGTS